MTSQPQRRSSIPVNWDSQDLLQRRESTSTSSDNESDVYQQFSPPSKITDKVDIVDDEEELMSKGMSNIRRKFDERIAGVFVEMLQDQRHRAGVPLDTDEEKCKAFQLLSTVPPFSYLENKKKYDILQELHKIEYTDGEVIIQQGRRDNDVYLLAEGRVVTVTVLGHDGSTVDTTTTMAGSPSGAKFRGYSDAPSYFGEWSGLFNIPRSNQIIAGSPSVVVYRMSGARFEALLYKNQAFRLKLAMGLRQLGIFAHIEAFVALTRRAVSHDDTTIDFEGLLTSYRKMVPAIHANLHSPDLDIEGWTYAVRRLPDTITSTYVYLLSIHVPMPFMHPNCDLKKMYVKTAARRRHAFALDHGKLLVVLREKFSDALDFLTLLCCYVHECTKLRKKLVRPSALDVMHKCLWPSGSNNVGYHRYAREQTATVEQQRQAMEKLPLTPEEREGLQTLWPKDFLYRIFDIICVHENIQVRSDLASSYIESTDRWAESIRKAAIDLLRQNKQEDVVAQSDKTGVVALGMDDVCISEVVTHIISSNTTSVRNLISPYILKNKDKIRAWGSEKHPEIINSSLTESDKLCALCNAYMKCHPTSTAEADAFDAKCFKTLRTTELTGIQVELIDLNALVQTYAEHNIEPDPFLADCFPEYTPGQGWNASSPKREKQRLLINIDYAFGKQAEQLISALSLLCDESLASVGVMGKAGGLQGKRGDIIVADYLVHQEGDEQTLIDNTGVDREALHTLSKRTVHSGGVLTVLGTLLQDTKLLNFYKKLYGCVSLEMEGSFYAKELRRYQKAGLLSNDINLRFLYYVSDTPLSTDQTETLSQDMSLAEVIPPQYAVTRCLLHPVLKA